MNAMNAPVQKTCSVTPQTPAPHGSGVAQGTASGGALDMEALVVEFAPAIRYIAQRLAFRLPPALAVDDLIHAGIIGLMDAASRFDPAREVRFKTYAEYRIRGAMLDEIRSLTWVPRSTQEKAGMLQHAYAVLQKRLGRAATEAEAAAELGMGRDEFMAFLEQAQPLSVVSLDDFGIQDGEGHSLVESISDQQAENPLLSLLSHDMRDRLVAVLNTLPAQERQVLTLYYREDLTMKEVGLVMGLTESRICQIHTQAIFRLKGCLKSAEAFSV